MFKKIINPIEDLRYQADSIENKYLINKGSKALGFFSAPKGFAIPAQIAQQDLFFYLFEGSIEIVIDDKVFLLKNSQLLLIPKMTAYNINIMENSKVLFVRL